MRTSRLPTLSRRDAGFSLIELLIVVIIILIMAAVGLPGILRFMRNHKVRGAAQQVASQIQTARARAIMRNVNTGVVFRIIDRDTYRFAVEDAPFTAESEAPLQDLPTGVQFINTGATGADMRFDRLGRWCAPGTNCPAVAAGSAPTCTPLDRCDDAPVNYIANNGAGALITVRDLTTGVGYQIGVTPGGRVQVKDVINDTSGQR
jgi:prepilin-type N-terminal cleavage/methylation domain-containing protein